MKDWQILTLIILGIAGIVFGIGVGMYFVDKNISCPHFAENVGLESKYDFLGGGCFVKAANGQWVHRDNYYNAIPVKQ